MIEGYNGCEFAVVLECSKDVCGSVACLKHAGGDAVVATGAGATLQPFLPDNVYGQGTEPDVTVVSRARTGYESVGIHAGTFTIRPQVNESFGYESNVLGLPHPRGSTLLQTNASIDAQSDNSHGSVNTGLSVTDNRYLDLANQSFTNWDARLGGTYNLGRDSASILVLHQNLTQTQRDLDVPQLDAPLPFTIDTVRLSYRAVFNRLSLTPKSRDRALFLQQRAVGKRDLRSELPQPGRRDARDGRCHTSSRPAGVP